MAKEFSQWNEAGRKYAPKKKKDSGGNRRVQPSRKKQSARGVGFAQHATKQAESARKAMKRGRHSAPGS